MNGSLRTSKSRFWTIARQSAPTCSDEWDGFGSQTIGASSAGRSGAAKGADAPGSCLVPSTSRSRSAHNRSAGQRSCLDVTMNFGCEAVVFRTPKKFPCPTWIGKRQEIIVRSSLGRPLWPDGETRERHNAPATIEFGKAYCTRLHVWHDGPTPQLSQRVEHISRCEISPCDYTCCDEESNDEASACRRICWIMVNLLDCRPIAKSALTEHLRHHREHPIPEALGLRSWARRQPGSIESVPRSRGSE